MSSVFEARIIIQANERLGKYRGHWIGTAGRLSEDFSIALPLGKDAVVDLRWYLEEYLKFNGAGDRTRAHNIERRMVGWGEFLFQTILGVEECTQVHQCLREATQADGRALITLESDSSEVLGQPWEMMRDNNGPILFQGFTLRRQVTTGCDIPFCNVDSVLRVLLVVSRPSGLGFIEPRNSIRAVLSAQDSLGDSVQIDFCEPPTLARLAELLEIAEESSAPFHIIHFDGHGYYEENTGSGVLCFENEWESSDYVNATTLGQVLSKSGVSLVILDACQGARMSEHPATGSVAPALLASGVGSVVAFSHSVHVEAARILVDRLYRDLARGACVGQALEAARHDLSSQSTRWLRRGPDAESIKLEDWFIPQLYQVGPDPTLVTECTPTVRSTAKAEVSVLKSFPGAPEHGFHGRAFELLKMERAFRRSPALVLTGMGGMGKTALAREAAAWWLRTGRFADAVYCSFEQKAGAERVVQLIGGALEGPDFTTKTFDEQRATAIELFRRRKLLVVWDNFESTLAQYQSVQDDPRTISESDRAELAKLYQDLVNGMPEGRLLVTCRPEETGLSGIHEVSLRGLARADSLYHLASILDAFGVDTERPGYERHVIEDLLQTLQDHPLSVKLVAPHLRDMTPEEIKRDLRVLLQRFENGGADQERNKSLLASFEFSSRRLSEPAQVFLPFLGLFESGVFEQRLAKVAGTELKSWRAVRKEYISLAITRVVDMKHFTHSYIILHPTLQMLSYPSGVLDETNAKSRYVKCYLSVAKEVRQTLKGRISAAGMALAQLEEANLWRAIGFAFACDQHTEGSAIAEVLQEYLRRSGRLREQISLNEWVAQNGSMSNPFYNPLRNKLDLAKTLSDRGESEQAASIIAEVDAELERQPVPKRPRDIRKLAICVQTLARRYSERCQFTRALVLTNKSISMFEKLDQSDYMDLVAALIDRSYAQLCLASYSEALADAERAREILVDNGEESTLTRVENLLGDIMKLLNRFDEAEVFYNSALRLARRQPDLHIHPMILGRLGSLHSFMGRQDLAMDHLREAFNCYQKLGDHEGQMQVCDLLGSAARREGDFDVAEVWYSKSREVASRRGATSNLIVVTNNLGGLCLDRARLLAKGTERDEILRKGLVFLKEAMVLHQSTDGSNLASTHAIIGVVLGELRDFVAADHHLHCALKLHKRSGSIDVVRDYKELQNLALARGKKLSSWVWKLKFLWASARLRVSIRSPVRQREL
jgi:tetratricopeptide (TPR) repeat protein